MQTYILALVFLIASLASGRQVCAAPNQMPIVFSARFYYPPGSAKTSHYHLYLMTAAGDKTRQITFGSTDDTQPLWSPDGKRVLFSRSSSASSSFCVWSAASGTILQVPALGDASEEVITSWTPDSRDVIAFAPFDPVPTRVVDWTRNRIVATYPAGTVDSISPDGKYAMIGRSSQNIQIVQRSTGSATTVPLSESSFDAYCWTATDQFAVLAEEPKARLIVYDAQKQHLRQLDTKWLMQLSKKYAAMTPDTPWPDYFQPIPGSPNLILAAISFHTSTQPEDYRFVTLDLQTGEFDDSKLTGGQFIVFSPDGRHFLSSPARDLTVYGKPLHGKQESVWSAPLLFGDSTNGRIKQVTPRLSSVDGADWKN